MNDYRENFGKQGRCRVTGFTGTIAGYTEFSYGCAQYLLSPKVDRDGKLVPGEWLDVSRIEILPEPKIEDLKGENPGCDSCKPSAR